MRLQRTRLEVGLWRTVNSGDDGADGTINCRLSSNRSASKKCAFWFWCESERKGERICSSAAPLHDKHVSTSIDTMHMRTHNAWCAPAFCARLACVEVSILLGTGLVHSMHPFLVHMHRQSPHGDNRDSFVCLGTPQSCWSTLALELAEVNNAVTIMIIQELYWFFLWQSGMVLQVQLKWVCNSPPQQCFVWFLVSLACKILKAINSCQSKVDESKFSIKQIQNPERNLFEFCVSWRVSLFSRQQQLILCSGRGWIPFPTEWCLLYAKERYY